jgi:MFS family permease
MLPLMAGLLTASILSGRAISRIGRYKPFPIAGTAVTTVGLFLLSRLEVDTPPWVASVYMLVLGVGLGLVMQVIVLVVQNDVEPRDIGVATSTATFFRSMGGSLGVALFGAIFASRLASELSALPPNVAGRFSGGVNISPEQVHSLTPEIRHDFLLAFVDALQPVFLVGAVLTLVAVVLACFLKEVPLRGTNRASSDLTAEEAAAGGTGAEAIIEPEPVPPGR